MSTEHAYHEVTRLGRELSAAQDRIVTLEHSLKLARVASTPWSEAMHHADGPTEKTPGQVAFEMWAGPNRVVHWEVDLSRVVQQWWDAIAAAVIAHHEATRPLPEVTIVANPSAEFNASLHDFTGGRTVPLDVALTAQFSPPAGGTEAPPSVGGDGEGEASGAENPPPPGETPRTDGVQDDPIDLEDAFAFARTLERELAAEHKMVLNGLKLAIAHRERAERAEEAVRELCGVLDRCKAVAISITKIGWGYDGDCGATEKAHDIEDMAELALAKHAPVSKDQPTQP